MDARLLAVPNASEGRDAAAIEAIGAAFGDKVELLDTHCDADHNRSVFTLAGEPVRIADALLDGARAALERIDMLNHTGEHPCVGALDVCPLVWTAPGDRPLARADAEAVAERLAHELELPVFLYGELARSPERRERAFFRRGGIAALGERMASGELHPDYGPPLPHERGGATLVTARPPLVAFNIELDTTDVAVAREIAAELRESGGGLPGVRAIGLPISDAGAQVSTNVEDPFSVPLARVVEMVRDLGDDRDARPVAAELVGLAPEAALEGFPDWIEIVGLDLDRHVIERRMQSG